MSDSVSAETSYYRSLGRRIAEQRRRAGLTQGQLAKRLDVAPSSISQIEKGSQRPAIFTVCQIEDILGLSPYSVFPLRDDDRIPSEGSVEENLVQQSMFRVYRFGERGKQDGQKQ